MAKDPKLERAGVSGFNKYKVYLHRREDDGKVFYVGKGKRWRENSKRSRNKHWHHTVNKHGFTVEVVAENITNEEACKLEKELIAKFGIDNLVNYTLGGEGSEGYQHTEETIQKMRGRTLSEAHKQKLSQSKLQKPTRYWLGKTRDPETVFKVAETLSRPTRQVVKEMLLQGKSRKEIKEHTSESLLYIRGVASQLRKQGYEVQRLKS